MSAANAIATLSSLVGEFHQKLGLIDSSPVRQYPSVAELPGIYSQAAEVLKQISEAFLGHSTATFNWYAAFEEGIDPDARPLRAHLILEEISEFLLAMESKDSTKMLDALVDLLYVTIGTARVLELPLGAAFEEVQRSNMSKEVQSSDPHKFRVRDKGPNYSAPNLRAVMDGWMLARYSPHEFIRTSQGTYECAHCEMNVADARKQLRKYKLSRCRGGLGHR